MALNDVVKKCDSWDAEVEDFGIEHQFGRYGVTVYFNDKETADEFRIALQAQAERRR